MLRLIINGKEAEVYTNEPVNLTYQFTDVSQINASKSNYSKTFRLPMTEMNQEIFGAVQEFSVITSFNPKLKMPASILDDSIPLMSGYVQVKAFYKQKGKYMDVECVFFGEVSDLSQKVGDDLLSDLNLSTYDGAMSIASVEATWAAANAAVRFGVVDRGENWSGSGTWNVGNYMDVSNPTGFMRVPNLLDKIFEAAGLTYESTFFSTAPMTDLYLMLNAGSLNNGFTDAQQNIPFHVGLTANDFVSSTSFFIVNFFDAGNYFDPGNNYSGGEFTVPLLGNGNYTFRVRIGFSTVLSTQDLEVSLFKNGVEWQNVIQGTGFNTTEAYELTTASSVLSAGDTIRVEARVVGSGSFFFRGTGSLTNPTTSLELLEVNLSGTDWEAAVNMPAMKQIDFLFGLQRMFNLVFIPDKNIPDKYQIEPYADYVTAGSAKDWSNKIDLNKDVQITPTTDLQARQYEWNMTAGKDFLGQQVLTQLDRIYGRFRVTDPANDFAVGKKEVKSPFASYTISNVPGTDFQILRTISPTGEILQDPLPRLAFWTGLQSLGNWYFGNGTNLKTTFPHFSDLSDFGAAVVPATIDLNYGYERKFRSIVANPRDALYYKYWHPFTGELYSADARMMTAFFRLTSTDISQMAWSDRIYIQDTYYRILSIDYVANDPGALAKVSLLKIVGADRLCSFIPFSFEKDGRIKFTNSSGAEVYQVSQGCCELFGGRYDQGTSFCWGQNQLT